MQGETKHVQEKLVWRPEGLSCFWGRFVLTLNSGQNAGVGTGRKRPEIHFVRSCDVFFLETKEKAVSWNGLVAAELRKSERVSEQQQRLSCSQGEKFRPGRPAERTGKQLLMHEVEDASKSNKDESG